MLAYFTAGAQVTFIIESLPDYTPQEDFLYQAGDINGWNPADVNHKLYKNADNKWETRLDSFPPGTTIEFKFTRGSWATVEKGESGEEIPNRTFTFGNGDTVYITIYSWADQGGNQSTAAENVIIMDEAFEMPQLNRTRRIWLYLPPDYEESNLDYPVIYMHDGQNLFDQYTSFAGEWEVDETLNKLFDQGYQVPIVVGIDHGGIYRTDELTPWNHPQYGGGQGNEYMAFVVETLKPYIDENYRTLPQREYTGIMGSSLGGLISTYGAMKYQDVFSKSGPFSPAYWINNDSIWDYISTMGMQQDIRFYQNVGAQEGSIYISEMYQMEDSLKEAGFQYVSSKVIPGGEHNEQTWREDFEAAYLWLFNSYAGISEIPNSSPVFVYPNPATNMISVKGIETGGEDIIFVMDTNGRKVKEIPVSGYERQLDISDLKPGNYIIRITRKNHTYIGKFVKL
jgi:predicted alpha/beta superfamily hydrolase